ncbi:hypothetical protein M2284_000328 [Rhodococcus sp. LBL1]|nr:hypothetical protein [Rhodococcus sp. LBL1]MDH6681426.1 hypothetical protein [Rhodococcus sp. LBL2]
MGSIIEAIHIPVGSVDAIFTGFIKSIDVTLNNLGDFASGLLDTIGS